MNENITQSIPLNVLKSKCKCVYPQHVTVIKAVVNKEPRPLPNLFDYMDDIAFTSMAGHDLNYAIYDTQHGIIAVLAIRLGCSAN